MSRRVRNLTFALIVLGVAASLVASSGRGSTQREPITATEPLPPASEKSVQRNAAPVTEQVGGVGDRVKELEAKVNAGDQSQEVLSELGGLYFQRRLYAQAADTYATAVEQSPGNLELRNGYATSLLFLGMVRVAEREYRKLVDADPTNPERYMNLAVALSHRNPPAIAEAVKSWQRVVELDTGGPLAEKARAYLASYGNP